MRGLPGRLRGVREVAGQALRSQLRALFVAVHVAAIALSAVPSPEGGLSRANWNDPTVQGEMAAWSRVFGMKPEPFTDALYGVAVRYQEGLDVILWPVVRWERLTGTGQSWKMFIAAHRFPSRLRIEARPAASGSRRAAPADDAGWELLFEERSPDATWMAAAFDVERLRASIFRWSWPGYAKSGKRACAALALRAFAEDPARVEVRCRFLKVRSLSPDEAARGEHPEATSKPEWTFTRAQAEALVASR